MTPPPAPVAAAKSLPAAPGPYARHIPALDGLRGLAILLVMASHLFVGTTTNGSWLLRSVGIALANGGIGVDLFFVLSGFLITGILFDSVEEPHFFRTFYARRILRIFPLYYGVLLALLLFTPLLGIRWHGMQWSLLLYLQNTGWPHPLFTFFPAPGISLDHFWSLAVEEQFYLVWPFVVYLQRRRRPLLWTCAALALASLALRLNWAIEGVPFNVLNRNTLTRADALLLGAALALLLRGRRSRARVLRLAPLCAAGFAGVFALGVLLRNLTPRLTPALQASVSSVTLALRYSILALFFAALLAVCLRQGSLAARLFTAAPLRFFGRYSYGLYVLHLIFLPFLMSRSRELLLHLTHDKGLLVVGSGLICFAVAVLAAWLSFRFYEQPFLRLKRFFAYSRSEVRHTAPVVS